MTIHHTMNAALTSRHMMPMDDYCTCACCNQDDLWRSEMDVSGYRTAHNDAMKLRYLGPCCNACTDAHVQCAGCDVATPADEARQDNDGDFWCGGCKQDAIDHRGASFPT